MTGGTHHAGSRTLCHTEARIMTSQQDPLVMTVSECAIYLKIGRGHCYEMVRQGRIPSVRLGKRLLIPRKGLERLLEGEGPIATVSAGKQ